MTETDHERSSRMIFMGDDSLADGFRLIGFETYPNPAPDEVDRVLSGLLTTNESAFVLLEDGLMQSDIPSLQRVLGEGGRIVILAIPPLTGPPQLTSEVAERLEAMFGPAALNAGRAS